MLILFQFFHLLMKFIHRIIFFLRGCIQGFAYRFQKTFLVRFRRTTRNGVHDKVRANDEDDKEKSSDHCFIGFHVIHFPFVARHLCRATVALRLTFQNINQLIPVCEMRVGIVH